MEAMAQTFKALSEPARLRILLLLLDGERCVCDLMAVLGMPQSTVSRHLAYLKNSGLVNGRRQGVWMYYRLADPVSELQERLIEFLRSCLPELSEARQLLIALDLHEKAKSDNACDTK